MLAGAVFGFWVNKRMSDKFFAKLLYVATFVIGWYILIDGSLSLISAPTNRARSGAQHDYQARFRATRAQVLTENPRLLQCLALRRE